MISKVEYQAKIFFDGQMEYSNLQRFIGKEGLWDF